MSPAIALAMLLAPGWVQADPGADEAVLKKAGVEVDGPGLLKFLGGFVPREGGVEEIAPLIKKMASDDFFEREEALKRVIALGPRALPFLRQALKESDKELVQRAEECLKIVEGGPGLDVQGAMLRLIAIKKPAGAAAALLEYLPFAANERLQDQAVNSLSDVALEGDKLAPALLAALEDRLPSRRAAAAQIVARAAYKDHRDHLHKLLADTDVQVRLKTGIALALQHEKDAIPVLINAMENASADQGAIVESLLQKLAEYKGPSGPFASPRARRDAWDGWWTANAAKVDLTRLTAIPKLLGRTLLLHATTGKVEEVDGEGKTIWQITGLQFPTAAHMIGEDRVAIVENRLRRVTIRTIKGAIERTVTVALPLDAHVQPDGGILVTTRLALIEYDKAGTLLRRIAMTGKPTISARKLPSGDYLALLASGHLVKVDAAGKESLRVPLGAAALSGGFDITPEARILVVDPGAGKVLEFDTAGKIQREWKVAGATSAVRLPNGNTLVACGEKVVEIDDRGATVWEHTSKGSAVHKASKR